MEKFYKLIKKLKEDYPNLDIEYLDTKFRRQVPSKEGRSDKGIYQTLILLAQENISLEEPDWTYVAAHIYLVQLYSESYENRDKKNALSFYGLIKELTNSNVYSKEILEKYTEQEINELEKVIDPEKDKLFNYVGVKTLGSRYIARSKSQDVMELPQERWMIIAMTLMQNETENKLESVKLSYWALSNLYMTVATPTLANAGTVNGQLSSCFIDTVDDDLRSIYDSNTDFAQISKNGGGAGVYLGKIRSRGSSIRGNKDAAGGVVPWMKQLNTTAVNVDQLGKRPGAIAVYLDVWHDDIQDFLDVKLNNGDERMRTHDIFTGVTLPNLFMERVEERGTWHLFDPHEVREVMGFSLEDYYDEEINDGSFRRKYQECIDNEQLSKREIPAIDIFKRILRSQLESGTPFMFYRDTVNQMNANNKEGIIYCSNLCTEITQNQSITVLEDEYLDENDRMVTIKKPGDFVVCNLSSINLARAVQDDVLEKLIPIQVRMLDNVIDVNSLPILQADYTNQRYRAIGLGTFGLHHLLALKNIQWESDEAVKFSDELYEKIAYLTIQSSMEISKEKGSYKLFKNSDWESGEYFTKRGYVSKDTMDTNNTNNNKTDSKFNWTQLMNDVKEFGIRNGYLMAIAPNATTSIIAGSTASIDPIFGLVYSEEKMDYKIPVTAPDYSKDTKEYYKAAVDIDQNWSIKQNAARQRHIDQAISFNLYVRNDVKASELLGHHLSAWKSGVKTTYYVRSTARN